MSLRRVDLRLILPHSPTRATVLGDLEAWRDGLASAGIDLVGEADQDADLVVAPASLARQAVSTGAAAIILEGRGGERVLARAGLVTRRFLPLPRLEDPDFLLPLEPGAGSRYALREWRPADTVLKRMRDRSVEVSLRLGLFPRFRPEQVVGLRAPAPPFPLAAAASLGVPSDAVWFLTLGHGDPLTRVAFHIFRHGDPQPTWVLKLSRIASASEAFDRDEEGLRLVREAGGAAAAHAPVLVGRFTAEGLPASLESAAVGEPLSNVIARRRSSSLAAVEQIAEWIVQVGRETAAPAGLHEERQRLKREVLPRWGQEVRTGLVDRLPPEIPGVLQHNDLGSWNIVVDGRSGFVALDWEAAREGGLPLCDLLYFLIDALPLVEGARSCDERVAEALRLLRGEAPLSPLLFAWLRQAASAIGVPLDAVPTIAALCWLHHGLSHRGRTVRAESVEAGSAAAPSPIDRLVPLWLEDPALGLDWPVWKSVA